MTKVNLMKKTVFQNLFNNLEKHLKCCGKYETVIDKNGEFTLADSFLDTL